MSWHIDGCEGACLACLIEETVLANYGTQGLSFLRRNVGSTPEVPIQKILADQEPLGAEFAKVWDDNVDKLYEE